MNLESSGRELESIVVGEIQKAYNAYAGILKREADNAYGVVEELREGPVSMPKDQEWIHFVTHDPQFIDPTIPLRSAENIHYPGQMHVAAQEIRAGLLERKSKYLRSYTAGWYASLVSFYCSSHLTLLTIIQVRSFDNTSSRIQVGGQGAGACHVTLST